MNRFICPFCRHTQKYWKGGRCEECTCVLSVRTNNVVCEGGEK